MKAHPIVIFALSIGLAGSAFAGGGPYPEPYLSDTGATKSRAEVTAELAEAQRLGLIPNGEESIPATTSEQEQAIVAAGRDAAEMDKSTATVAVKSTDPMP